MIPPVAPLPDDPFGAEPPFAPGEEEMNAHAGSWKLVDGQLQVEQGGNDAGGGQLVPRAYLAHRFFSSDDFSAEVLMNVRPLGRSYPDEPPDEDSPLHDYVRELQEEFREQEDEGKL